MSRMLVLGLLVFSVSGMTWASATRVGNGNDGNDLENRELVTKGVLVDTREKAIDLIEVLNVENVPNLGSLKKEILNSPMYLVKNNMKAEHSFDKGMESTPDGQFVYARTFAQPQAATRFFPQALMLSEDQLIALHIHEGLHRALPPHVRENESVVTEVTLAITGPEANFDSIRNRVSHVIPEAPRPMMPAQAALPATTIKEKIEPTEKLKLPSSVKYTYSLFGPANESTNYELLGMHLLESHLYPFGKNINALGVGLGLSIFEQGEERYLGPVRLSANLLLATWRRFDVRLWGEQQLYTISDSEVENSPYARDITTVGLSMAREADYFYVRNTVSVTGESDVKQQIGGVEYTHTYGSILNLGFNGGVRLGIFTLGGDVQLLLMDSYRVEGGSFATDTGRFRVLKAGPEVGVQIQQFKLKAFAYGILDKTQDVSMDYFGDIMGQGSGSGQIGASAEFAF